MAGEANRKIFFNDRSLGLSEGYRILSGAAPRIEYINRDTDESSESKKRLALLLRRERIDEGTNQPMYSLAMLTSTSALVFLTFFEDVDRKMKDWGNEGKMNPFNEVYDVSFHLIECIYERTNSTV